MKILQVKTNSHGQFLAIIENGQNFVVGNIARESGQTSFSYTPATEYNGSLSLDFGNDAYIEYSQNESVASLPLPENPAVPQTEPITENWGGDLGRIVTAVILWIDSKLNKPTYKQN